MLEEKFGKRVEVVGPIARPADGKSSRDAEGRTELKTRRRLVWMVVVVDGILAVQQWLTPSLIWMSRV